MSIVGREDLTSREYPISRPSCKPAALHASSARDFVQSPSVVRLFTLLLLSLAILFASCSSPTQSAGAIIRTEVHGHRPITSSRFVGILAPLIDPAKLDTLKGDRAPNTRLRKIVYWLEEARQEGEDLSEVIQLAQVKAGYSGTPRAAADAKSLLRNLTILERLGCLEDEGMENLRRGRAPVIKRGPYAGEIAAVDHIIPRAVVPELDEKLFNLEFMPESVNRKKSAVIGQRQRTLAMEWNEAGMLSKIGLKAIARSPKR
jgi:hypothetical protein